MAWPVGDTSGPEGSNKKKPRAARCTSVGPARYCSPRHRMPLDSETRAQNTLDDVAANICFSLYKGLRDTSAFTSLDVLLPRLLKKVIEWRDPDSPFYVRPSITIS